jgi:hypothetical protein
LDRTLPGSRNDGQTDPRVKFVSRAWGYTLFLTSRELGLSSAAAGPSRRRQKRSSSSIPVLQNLQG